MLFRNTIFMESPYPFTGDLIYVIFIWEFNFKAVVRSVIVADRSITLHDVLAFVKKMVQMPEGSEL